MSRRKTYPGIVDVAREAQVSPSTVSRTFSRPGYVSKATAKRIFDAANSLGYRSKKIVPVTTLEVKHHLILLIVSDISNPAFAQLIRCIQHECMRENYGLLIADTEETKINERDSLHDFNNVDGVVLASSRLSDTMIRKFAQHHKVVMVNREVRGIPSVIPDYSSSFESMVDRLIALGHTSITYLTGPEASWAEGMRWRTLFDVCKRKNMPLKRLPGKYPTLQAGQEAFRKFMKQPSSTAIITYNDLQAMGFITSARQHHVEIPGRFSVIGIDDTPNCTLISPSLSSIHIDRREAGKTATAILFGMVNGRNQSNAGKQGLWEIPTSFIERDSIGIPLADC